VELYLHSSNTPSWRGAQLQKSTGTTLQLYFHSNTILTYPYLGIPSGLFPSGFPTKTLYEFLISPTRATCPAHFIIYHLIILIILGAVYKLGNSLCSLLQPPATSPQNPVLKHPQSYWRDQVSHPYLTTGKMTVLNISVLAFREDKRF
jgi:hypothetical protein